MALYRPSAIVAAISGKLGGVVFVRNKGSNVVRHRPAGRGGRSIRHETPARRLVLLQRRWRTLTADQKTAWATFAVQFPSTNRLGIRRALSAYLAYVRYNLTALQYDDDIDDVPAQDHPITIPQDVSWTPSTSFLFVSITDFPPPSSVRFLLYGAMLPRDALPKAFHNYRFLKHYTFSLPTILNIAADWQTKWPLPVLGQATAVRVVFHSQSYRVLAKITLPALTA